MYEAGYGRYGIIGITQPRRVAATSTAVRVAVEMGDQLLKHAGDPANKVSKVNSKGKGNRSKVQMKKKTDIETNPEVSVCEAVDLNFNVGVVDESVGGKRGRLPLRSKDDGIADLVPLTKKPKRQPLRLAARSLVSIAREPTLIAPTASVVRTANRPIIPVPISSKSSLSLLPSTDSSELQSSSTDGIVAYQVRFDSTTVRDSTKVLFMTDGILLREITDDLLLRKYSVVILDEAHERNVNTDILLGMLSRAVPLRRSLSIEETAKWNSVPEHERQFYEEPIAPLKLIIMSATLRIDDFKNPVLFPITPPVINVESRQYPVVTHFAKRTELKNYLHDAYRKVCQIHRKLPPGGILVFLTGKREIHHMCRKLQKALRSRGISPTGPTNAVAESDVAAKSGEEKDGFDIDAGIDESARDEDDDDAFADFSKEASNKEDIGVSWDPESDGEDSVMSDGVDDDDFEAEDYFEHAGDDDVAPVEDIDITQVPMNGADVHQKSNSNEVMDAATIRSQMLAELLGPQIASNSSSLTDPFDPNATTTNATTPLVEEPSLRAIILPLSAMMSPAQQAKVFREQPPGTRLIVVATNVAETSITIPGIRYVVDCGRQKSKMLQTSTGIWYVMSTLV